MPKLPHNLQIHGFASQGWLMSSGNNNVFGKSSSDSGSFDFRELGLNASMRPLTNLQFSAQMMSRTAGEGSPGNIRLDYGFIDYTYFTGETSKLGIRLGRMKTPLGLYNDTRDVAFTRPSILLPQSIYFDRTRKLALAADGVHLYGEYRSDLGDISFQAGVVRPLVRGSETEVALLTEAGADRPGHFTPNVLFTSRVMYELDEGRVRLAFSASQLNIDYSPALGLAPAAPEFGPGSFQFTPLIFSAQYNAERWSLTSEYAIRHLEYTNFQSSTYKLGATLNTLDVTGESYYFQGVYRFTPAWEAFARYDVYYADWNDRSGKQWAIDRKNPATAKTRFAKDITVGLRWNITPQFMLRAEYHRVDGTGWLSAIDNSQFRPSPPVQQQEWDLFSILGSYRF
ncbi:OprO/OprP family phosphate-selective porin [Nitrosospira sp. Nsp2]|uniref:OprO/OprP family phosphate-selective porin n=1 Tax=Nitrosospira sp. Nsp2 TaxID=136548 RepID=UPI00215995A5|nr:OprO/OprP family phosphate-selective porin [Nitrosospira sp. Nsp2]